MFTSRRFAPPRTWSRATSSAPWKSFPSIRRRNRAEPVTFVRSPTMTKFVSPVKANGSSPLKRVTARCSGMRRGGMPLRADAIARVWSGVVPQQPPTTFTSPLSANSRSRELVVSGPSS